MAANKRPIRRTGWVLAALIAVIGASSGCDDEYFYDDYGYGGYGLYYDGFDYVTQGLGYSGFDDWAGSSISTFAGDFVSWD